MELQYGVLQTEQKLRDGCLHKLHLSCRSTSGQEKASLLTTAETAAEDCDMLLLLELILIAAPIFEPAIEQNTD